MRVGIGRFVLHIPGARTLKDRRQVVKSFKDRVRAQQPVSVAEVGDANRLQVATFGVAVVSSSSELCHDTLNKVAAMAGTLPDAVLSDVRIEVLAFGDGGESVAGGMPSFASGRRPAALEIEPVRRPKRSVT